MLKVLWVLLLIGWAVLITSWLMDWRPRNTAVSAAVPAVAVPLGPLPGPGRTAPMPTSPYHADPVGLTEGKRLFANYNCGGCHGPHGGGGMGPSLRDVSWIYGSHDAEIFDSIAEGRPHGMPTWGQRLPADQIWKITSYIKSMRTEWEPQPPTPTKYESLPATQDKQP